MKKTTQTPEASQDWRDAIAQQSTRRTEAGDAASRQRRWHLRAVVGISLLSIAALIGANVWLFQSKTRPSPVAAEVALTTLLVESDGVLGEYWVRETYPEYLQGGLLQVDGPAMQAALRAHPQIRDAQVHIELPGTLRVRLQERQPAFLTRFKDTPRGTWLVVTRDGWIYDGSLYPADQLAAMPFLGGFKMPTFAQGLGHSPVVAPVVALLDLAQSRLPRLQREWRVINLADIQPGPAAPAGLIEVRGQSIARVVFAGEHFEDQLTRLAEIMVWSRQNQPGQPPLSLVDLSYPGQAIVRPALLAHHAR